MADILGVYRELDGGVVETTLTEQELRVLVAALQKQNSKDAELLQEHFEECLIACEEEIEEDLEEDLLN